MWLDARVVAGNATDSASAAAAWMSLVFFMCFVCWFVFSESSTTGIAEEFFSAVL
jgi:hypothetical protein